VNLWYQSAPLRALCAVGALALAACGADAATDIARDAETNEVTETDELGVFAIQEGDCLLLPNEDGSGSIQTITALPCAEPHRGEVYAILLTEHEEWPGDDVIAEESWTACVAAFDDRTGLDYASDLTWDVFHLYPSEASFNEADDREIVCIAIPIDRELTSDTLPRV
jgi:hypothetical protein